MKRTTTFSPDRVYRYTLWREWQQLAFNDMEAWTMGETKPPTNQQLLRSAQYCMFIGLNPSTADEVQDDATVRKCIQFSKLWGFGALCMTNIFAFRARDPKVMKAHPEPIGPDNDRWLQECARNAGRVIAAWGTHGDFMDRGAAVKKLIPNIEALRLTKHGHPEHPCYITYEIEPVPFR